MGKRGQGTPGLLCPKTEEEWLAMMSQVTLMNMMIMMLAMMSQVRTKCHRWGGGDDDDGGGASSGCGGGKKKIIQTRLLVVDIYSDWAGPCVAIRVSPYIVN